MPSEEENILGLLDELADLEQYPATLLKELDIILRYRLFDIYKVIQRMVRLIRLADHCADNAPLWHFQAKLDHYYSTEFRRMIFAAGENADLPAEKFSIEKKRVIFLEEGMQKQGDQPHDFHISYNEMPLAAAMLDVLIQALGYTSFKQLLAPILEDNPAPTAAHDVSNAIRNEFDRYLNAQQGTETENTRKKFAAFHSFLSNTKTRIVSDAIGNDLIVEFWRDQVNTRMAERNKLILFKSTAIAALHFFVSLQVNESANYLDGFHDTIGAGAEEEGTEIDIAQADDQFRYNDLYGIGITDPLLKAGIDWTSPVKLLNSPSFSLVKWLDQGQYNTLSSCLGNPETGDTLMGGIRFNSRFTRTLLRVDTFSPIQASPRQRAALYQNQNQPCYEQLKNKIYDHCLQDISMAGKKALKILSGIGDRQAIVLLEFFYGSDVARQFFNLADITEKNIEEHPELLEEHPELIEKKILSDLLMQLSNGTDLSLELKEIHTDISKAGINREGFGANYLGSGVYELAMSQAVPTVCFLISELKQIIHQISKGDLANWAMEDTAIFRDIFTENYGDSPLQH